MQQAKLHESRPKQKLLRLALSRASRAMNLLNSGTVIVTWYALLGLHHRLWSGKLWDKLAAIVAHDRTDNSRTEQPRDALLSPTIFLKIFPILQQKQAAVPTRRAKLFAVRQRLKDFLQLLLWW